MPGNLTSSLKSHFGFSSFRPGQEEAIQALSRGNHSLIVMPTGAGKSLIFQLAALNFDGLTLVISPLIALMKDQVDGLTRREIPATYINSTLTSSEQSLRLQKLAQGKYRLVYIAPERLRNVSFLNALKLQTVSLLAVDEAHCISEWGHDFRPDYLHIAQARTSLGNPLTAALTATATPQVQGDIIQLLGLSKATRIVTGFNRSNMTLDVRYKLGLSSKLRILKELLSTGLEGAIIVYTGTRRDAEEVTEFAHQVVKISAEFYHAGLGPEARTRIQNDFISGKLNVIVATNAFGMGIDRADVRHVIHHSLPGSLEAYYQEAGRAGRDGQPSRASLLYDPQDRALQEFFITNSIVDVEDLHAIYNAIRKGEQTWVTLDDLSRITGLHPVQIKVGLSGLERAGALEHLGDEGVRMLFQHREWVQGEIDKAANHNKEHIKHRQAQLDGIIRYAEANSCRRKIILDYFGDKEEAQADDCCDNCRSATTGQVPGKETGEMSHGERAALIILDCIHRSHIKIGRKKLAQILHGSKAQDIIKFHHDKNAYYGRLVAVKQSDIEVLIEQLIEKGYIKVIGGEYPVLSLTPSGENAIHHKATITLTLDESKLHRTKPSQKPEDFLQHIVDLGDTKSQIGIPELISALGNQNGNVRLLAASALGKIRALQAVEPLLKLLRDEVKPQVRQYAVKALGRIGDKRATTVLEKISKDEQEKYYVRESAHHALKHLKDLPTKVIAPTDLTLDSQLPDAISTFLNASHPRPLLGSWQCGWSLGFHSHFSGGDWARSGVGDLTYRLKYEGDTSVLPALVAQTVELIQSHPELAQVDVIFPVPPSKPRETDPVAVFCKALAGKINLQLQTSLVKNRQTQPQKELKTLAQKRANVAGAFRLQGEVKGKGILLVDDLFDSGATLDEITRLLQTHGAARINVLTMTRTIHSDA